MLYQHVMINDTMEIVLEKKERKENCEVEGEARYL